MKKINAKNRKVVLLTGASSGLGLALAEQFIGDDDYFLVLTARRESLSKFSKSTILSAENIWIRKLNILDHEEITKVIREINSKLGGVDILINNAGVSERGTVEDSEDSNRQSQLDVNYLAPFELIAQVLSLMRRKRFGKIINISSAGGFMAMPTMSAYSASKFALEGASEALWYEMKPWGIHVTLVVPGFINSLGHLNTKETERGRVGKGDPGSAYFEHYKGMSGLINKKMIGAHSTNKIIALKISKVIRRKKPPLRVYITLDALIFYWIRKVAPPIFYHFIVYKMLPNIRIWGTNKYKIEKKVA